MNNRFREHLDEEPELEEEIEVKVKPRPKQKELESSNAFFKKLFTEGVVSKESATEMLPFLIFLSVLCMLYIANSHMAIKNIRNIDKLNKEVKELSWEYKSLKADLMFKSKLTEVAKKVDTLGIKELTEPPKKIVINSNEY
ncbi:FtsL-like putative cell division protein [Pedobacter nyackensis]|uniref:FtsL-like putative cell division protein n=1 Tax=Pedobacter nyackensis TaxID=475255 RepID=UPI00292F1E1B|nr:FtsL-like putative cell division protein [Pedobacter nyackensis]